MAYTKNHLKQNFLSFSSFALHEKRENEFLFHFQRASKLV